MKLLNQCFTATFNKKLSCRR